MSLVTTALQSLINEGNDAQGKLYEAVFSGGVLGSDTSNMTIRCSGFTPVFPTQSTYAVNFVTAKIERPTTKVDLTRNFSLTFRSDDNWYLYKQLLLQHSLTMNASKSYVNTSLDLIEDYLFNVNVNRIVTLSNSSSSKVDRLFNFRKCWISEITSPDFSTSDASPVTINCKINFLEMEDWQSGLTDNESSGSAHTGFAYYGSADLV